MDNSNTNPAREQATPSPSSHSPQSSFQGNTLLLVAALLIVIGFFLPWNGTGGYGRRDYDYDDEFGMTSINGTTLISLVSKIPEIGWLLTVYLLLIPIGGIIVAYNASQRSFSEKVMMSGIASAIFIPLSVFTLYLSVPKNELYDEDFFIGGMFKLGIGFIMMAIGGIYCLIYAIGKISQNMKNASSPGVFKYGAIGGILTAVLIYLLLDNMNSPGSSIFYIYQAVVIGGILLSCYLYRTQTANANYHSGLVTGFVFSGAYVITLLIIASITSEGGTGQLGRVVIFMLVFQALYGFVITSLMPYGSITTAGGISQPQTPVAGTTATTSTTDTSNMYQSPPVVEQPKVVQPPFDWGAYFKRNKKTILVITGILVAGIAAWIILKPNPERSGRKAGKAYCNCGSENNKARTKAYEDLISGFDSAHYKTRGEARGKLQEALTKLQTEYTDCSTKASEKYSSLRKKFRDDYRQLAKFESAYFKASSSCRNDTSGITSLSNKLEEKLRTIKEAEPDIEKIKADIISQSIPGWEFSYLTEIKQAAITNTARSGDRIEYTVDLKLEHYSTKEAHDAQIIVAYEQGDYGWSLSSLNEVYITYTNTATVDEWKAITPLSNCSYSIIHEGRKFWVQDGSYGSKYKGGGDDAEEFYLSSTQIFIMSRESVPVKLVFRYTPNAQ